MGLNSDITLNIQANLDSLNKSIKAINKSMKIDLGTSIHNALKEATKGLKEGIAKNMPINEISQLKAKIREATKVELRFKLDQASKDLINIGAQITGTYASFKGLISKPLHASIDFNNAINEINRFANLSTSELDNLKKDIWDLGKNNGVGLPDILKTTELSSQLGAPKKELKDFSQLALNLQVGLKLGVEESVSSITKISKAFKLNTEQLSIFGDEVTSMAESTKTSAKSILEVTKTTLAGAKAFGLSAKETSALSASFLSVGLDSSEASSSINKFFTELNNIDNATPAFQQALAKMGIDAEQLKEDIQDNPQVAIQNLFEDLNNLDDEERFGVISELFGKKMANNINSAKDGVKAFNLALDSTKDSSGALQNAVDRVAGDGFGDLVISLGSAFKHLAVSIGDGFVPMLSRAFSGIKSLTEWISNLLDNNKIIGQFIAGLITGITAIKVLGIALAGFRTSITLLFYPLQYIYKMLSLNTSILKTKTIVNKIYTTSLQSIRLALGSLGKGFMLGIGWIRVFNIALLTTPIGWFGLLLAGVALAIYKFWKPIKAFFGGFFKGLYEGLAPLREAFSNLWTSIKTAFAPLAPLFSKIFGEVNNTEEELNSFAQVGFMVGKTFGGFISFVAKPFEWLIELITWVIDGVSKLTNWIGSFFDDDKKQLEVNATKNIKGSLDETLAKQNENKAKMLSSIQSSQTDNSKQIHDYKQITINTTGNAQEIARAINSYSYDDDDNL